MSRSSADVHADTVEGSKTNAEGVGTDFPSKDGRHHFAGGGWAYETTVRRLQTRTDLATNFSLVGERAQ